MIADNCEIGTFVVTSAKLSAILRSTEVPGLKLFTEMALESSFGTNKICKYFIYVTTAKAELLISQPLDRSKLDLLAAVAANQTVSSAYGVEVAIPVAQPMGVSADDEKSVYSNISNDEEGGRIADIRSTNPDSAGDNQERTHCMTDNTIPIGHHKPRSRPCVMCTSFHTEAETQNSGTQVKRKKITNYSTRRCQICYKCLCKDHAEQTVCKPKEKFSLW